MHALAIRGASAGYGGALVLRDISLAVPQGAIVALLGANGAGKSTMLRAAAGLLRLQSGEIWANGTDVTTHSAHLRSQAGICLVPEGRGIFGQLTVRENLRLFTQRGSSEQESTDHALAVFPALSSRLSATAGSLSGGQQQMLALCRALVTRPRVVLLDEVSMGLAPLIIDEIFVALKALAASGVALLIVEQYVQRVLEIADRVYLLDNGHISFEGPPSDLDEDALLAGYLGGSSTRSPDPS